jgi:hypothetical protein
LEVVEREGEPRLEVVADAHPPELGTAELGTAGSVTGGTAVAGTVVSGDPGTVVPGTAVGVGIGVGGDDGVSSPGFRRKSSTPVTTITARTAQIAITSSRRSRRGL